MKSTSSDQEMFKSYSALNFIKGSISWALYFNSFVKEDKSMNLNPRS